MYEEWMNLKQREIKFKARIKLNRNIHTQWSWCFKQPDWLAISESYDMLGSEYKIKLNCWSDWKAQEDPKWWFFF